MNNRGNIMLNMLFFLMAIAVVVAFISPLKTFIDMAQQSDNLNCRGYIFNGNENHTLSFNESLNGGASGNPTGCLAIKLYLPYLLLVVLIVGVSKLLYSRAEDFFTGEDSFGP
jgi:hypothetical protein